jgi:hypothetical protein
VKAISQLHLFSIVFPGRLNGAARPAVHYAMSLAGLKQISRGSVASSAYDALRKSHPRNVGAGTVGGFQGNNVGRVGLNCKL